jgi:hypothetical protein
MQHLLHDVNARALPLSFPQIERRDVVRRAAVVRRIAAEFREMPGLLLSVPQASRLLGLDERACQRILEGLEDEGLLRRRPGGLFGRA